MNVFKWQPGVAHRPEIDGLRAIAAASVILFHAGVDWMEGGFLGVDVFFAISGFLITRLIVQDLQEGRFDLAVFYARRTRRILPALLFMMVVTVIPAMLMLLAAQRIDFLRTMASASLSVSNIWLAFTSGYFDAAASERPLLHTWSLGVEEQYYLLFPLAMMGLWRLGRRWLAWVLGLAALASFALAVYGWRNYPSVSFFLAPSRAWELLAGALGALAHMSRKNFAHWPRPALGEILSFAGLVAIVASICTYVPSGSSPSVYSLLATLGTVAILMFADEGRRTSRVIGMRPLAAVGLASYSAYLWHQPVLVFGRLAGFDTAADSWVLAGMLLVITSVAFLSWRWVEQPMRRGTASPRRVLAIAAAASLLLAITAILATMLQTGKAPVSVAQAYMPPARTPECFDLAAGDGEPWSCAINPGAERKPSFIVYGDSHALQMLPAFELAAAQSGRTGVFAARSGCAPLLGTIPLTHSPAARAQCKKLGERVFPFARENGVSDVFLLAKWSYYTHLGVRPRYINALGQQPGDPVTEEGSRSTLAQGAKTTAIAAQQAGVRLHVIMQSPSQPTHPSKLYEEAWAIPYGIEERLRGNVDTQGAPCTTPDGRGRRLAQCAGCAPHEL